MLTQILQSEAFLSILAATVAAVWSTEKGARVLNVFRNRRVETALLILEVAIAETYEKYVQSLKATSADGKLQNGSREQARDMALKRARALAKEHGLDLDKVLGGDTLRAHLERVLKKIRKS